MNGTRRKRAQLVEIDETIEEVIRKAKGRPPEKEGTDKLWDVFTWAARKFGRQELGALLQTHLKGKEREKVRERRAENRAGKWKRSRERSTSSSEEEGQRRERMRALQKGAERGRSGRRSICSSSGTESEGRRREQLEGEERRKEGGKKRRSSTQAGQTHSFRQGTRDKIGVRQIQEVGSGGGRNNDAVARGILGHGREGLSSNLLMNALAESTRKKYTLFCDYYNRDEDDCEWHYKACGAPCLKTCRNPSGKCLHDIPGLEGCYPKCPKHRPFLDENTMKCVAQCDCYGQDGTTSYKVGEEVKACNICLFCNCTLHGIECVNNTKVCCEFEGKLYPRNTTINKTDDGKGNCSHILCGEHGRVHINYYRCCRCLHSDGKLYLPGETMNSTCQTDVYCDAECQEKTIKKECPDPGCERIVCLGNGTYSLTNTTNCGPVVKVECPNKVTPRKVYNDPGCCYHYECPKCLNADGTEVDPGDQWTHNCMICTCIAPATAMDDVTVMCVPISCSPIQQKSCPPGQAPVAVLTERNQCCPKAECRCHPGLCNDSEVSCPSGFELTCNSTAEYDCCPTFYCTRKPVCLVDDIEYEVGVFVYIASQPCSECRCSSEVDPNTELNLIVCQTIKCYMECQPGYEYKMLPMKCCGTCMQVACILTTEFNTTHIIKPGDSWFPDNVKCSYYTCSMIKGKLTLAKVKKACPLAKARACVLVADDAVECCSKCDTSLCKRKTTTVSFSESTPSSYVDLAYCELSSDIATIALPPSGHKPPACNCCGVLVTSVKQVVVTYNTGSEMRHTYSTAETCGCRVCKE